MVNYCRYYISCQARILKGFNKCILNMFQYPEYYEKVFQPISLNDIKMRLETNTPRYAYINDVLNDLMLVFTNALSYYPVSPVVYRLN